MSKLIGKYQNGNYTVSLYVDGTKVRQNELDSLIPEFAENCDCKITDCCDGGCPWCYEGCIPEGKHGDILNKKFLNTLHPYTELALNGNDLSHPDLIPFLKLLKKKKVIANLTVNQIHFERKQEFIKQLVNDNLIFGLGISLKEVNQKFIDLVKQYSNAVIHTIAGITTMQEYKALAHNGLKVLILGYKELKRGQEYYANLGLQVYMNKDFLYNNLVKIIDEGWFDVISFDNLAIEQLNVMRFVNEDEWKYFYMGDDAQYTFYLDLVEDKFAANSLAPAEERYDLLDNIDDMFKIIRNRKES